MRPGSCLPNGVFTAPRCPTSPRRPGGHRRCSTATSPTRRTCWPRWPSRSFTTSSCRRAFGCTFPSRRTTTGSSPRWSPATGRCSSRTSASWSPSTNSPPPRPGSPRCRTSSAVRHRHRHRVGATRPGQGHATALDAEHIALAIALLFERFTTVCLRPDTAGLGLRLSDAEPSPPCPPSGRRRCTASRTKGNAWISHCPNTFRRCWPRWMRSSKPRSSR